MKSEWIIWRWTVTGLVALVALAMGVFVWPTRFRSETVKVAGVELIYRTDRFSGETKVINPIREYQNQQKSAIKLPPGELDRIIDSVK